MQPVITIAALTFKEAIRSKVIYAVIFFTFIIVIAAALFGSVSIGGMSAVVRDFGLGCISLFAVAYTVISGSTLLSKELNKKTIFNILSRPISRTSFVFGKFFGLLLMAITLTALMGGVLSIFDYLLNGKFDALILVICVFMFLELSIVAALSLLFSSVIITPFLCGACTFFIFVVGRSASYINEFISSNFSEETSQQLSYLASLALPQLQKLNIIDYIDYPSFSQFGYAVLYSFSYSTLVLLVATLLFSKKEFNK